MSTPARQPTRVTFEEYLAVAGDRPKVAIMRRRTPSAVDELYPRDTRVLECVRLDLPLADIYRSLSF